MRSGLGVGCTFIFSMKVHLVNNIHGLGEQRGPDGEPQKKEVSAIDNLFDYSEDSLQEDDLQTFDHIVQLQNFQFDLNVSRTEPATVM